MENNLPADEMFKIGDFQILLDEKTGELKIMVHRTNKHLLFRPKTDNSAILIAKKE